MTQEEIIRMAREAGFDTDLSVFNDGTAIALKFAELLIEATKEKAASVAAGMLNDLHAYGFGVPAAIRSMK